MDGASRGKFGPAGIGGVLRDYLGYTSVVFSESVGCLESNEEELLALGEP